MKPRHTALKFESRPARRQPVPLESYGTTYGVIVTVVSSEPPPQVPIKASSASTPKRKQGGVAHVPESEVLEHLDFSRSPVQVGFRAHVSAHFGGIR